MGIFFIQSDHTYSRISAGDFKYKGRQVLQRNNTSSEWILYKLMFQKLIQALEPEDIELFATRLCNQIPKYKSWQPNPQA